MKTLENILAAGNGNFHQVVPYMPGRDKFITMDFTASNNHLTDEVLGDIERFSRYVDDRIQKAGAVFGIGGYNEHRTVYRMSSVFDGENKTDEPRRLHLGVDIWGNAGTPIMTPMNAIVHSLAYNDRKGDYGATILLQHELEGTVFFTLYGHLSLASLENKKEGTKIDQGEVFAWLGAKEENGYWPPHLHLQVIKELEGWKGDYPGVCRYSEREKYLENCPDPELIIRMQPHTI